MRRFTSVVVVLLTAGCLNTVEERWCGPSLPCSAGFVCTATFHCVPSAPRVDAGTGGGGGATGGGGGGGTVVGGGAGGGGGAATCSPDTCANGCCVGARCVLFAAQSPDACGEGGLACARCSATATCRDGRCSADVDGGGIPPQVGTPCTADSQCGSDGLSFCIPETSGGTSTGFVGGYCSRFCSGATCPAGARCVPSTTSTGGSVDLCVSSCTSVTDCRMGYRCDTSRGAGVCLP